MNIHEYQGKEILRRYGVATPRGYPCFSVAEADEAARKLGGNVWVVKAANSCGRPRQGRRRQGRQIPRRCPSLRIGHSRHDLVTHQTGPEGRVVKRLLVRRAPDIRKELYVGMVVDRASQRRDLDGEFPKAAWRSRKSRPMRRRRSTRLPSIRSMV